MSLTVGYEFNIRMSNAKSVGITSVALEKVDYGLLQVFQPFNL